MTQPEIEPWSPGLLANTTHLANGSVECRKKRFSQKKFLNKEWNITTKIFVSVWFIHFSIYFYHLIWFTNTYYFNTDTHTHRHTHTHTHTHIYISSSSSCHAASMDISDPLSPLLPNVLVFARPYVGVHRSTSLMSSSLLLQQCSACLVRLTWIVFVMGGRWPYS